MMRPCPKCNQPNVPDAAFCHNCASPLNPAPTAGAPPNQQQWSPQGNQVFGQQPTASGASQRAMIALVLAIVSLVCCGPFTGIPAAVVGWMELDAINKGQSSADGKWMAQVGLWGGIACTALHIIGYVLYVIVMILSAATRY